MRLPSRAVATLCAATLGAALGTSAAHAQQVGVIYDQGGKFDKSFNEAVYDGLRRYRDETGNDFAEFELTNLAQSEQAMRRMIDNGVELVIVVGFSSAPAVEVVAAEYPEARFTVLDTVVEMPNVQSAVFREHEGSFLVGALGAMASQTGRLGFVGGRDIPLIRRFGCGYLQGARHINPEAEVFQNMTGTTAAAWNDPTRGGELTASQIDRGADVIFAAAGATGLGVYQMAEERGVLAIGVDSNQNYLHPGTMLTSMVKRVDVVAFDAAKAIHAGTWEAGVLDLGLAEAGVGAAMDDYNADLVTDEMRARLAEIEAAIISGELAVIDYMTANRCE